MPSAELFNVENLVEKVEKSEETSYKTKDEAISDFTPFWLRRKDLNILSMHRKPSIYAVKFLRRVIFVSYDFQNMDFVASHCHGKLFLVAPDIQDLRNI